MEKKITCLWIRRLNIVKMTIHVKLIWRFSSLSPGFFVETDKLILKIIWELKGPRRGKTILKKKNTVGGLIFSNFKIYYKAIVFHTMWH